VRAENERINSAPSQRASIVLNNDEAERMSDVLNLWFAGRKIAAISETDSQSSLGVNFVFSREPD
jgi:hypothetical protein